MADNYPVLCTIRLKDKRFNVTARVRVKPVMLKFGTCSAGDCWKSNEMQTWSSQRNNVCAICRNPLNGPIERKMFKLYFTCDELLRLERVVVVQFLWRKTARFRRSESRWGSKEIYCFKRDWESLHEWFRYNRDGPELDGKGGVKPRPEWEKKLSIDWRKEDLPSEQELDALAERRALLRKL